MNSNTFKFKFFELRVAENVFPVTTDSVLLGAWVEGNDLSAVLDLGTGSGLISLMIAQKTKPDCMIYALEVNEDSFVCAQKNFASSPWPQKLKAINMDAAAVLKSGTNLVPDHSMDLIVSNPPYFEGQLHSDDENETRARHQLQFDFKCLAGIAQKFLKESGVLAVVIPMELEYKLTSVCALKNFFLKRMCRIQHRLGSKYSLCLCEYTPKSGPVEVSSMVLFDHTHQRTEAFDRLTQDYYI